MSDGSFTLSGKIKNDIILILTLAVLSCGALVLMQFFHGEGKTVTVMIDGREVFCLELTEDCEETFSTELGKNTVVIRDGEAYVSSADCPDGVCTDHAPIKNSGETIVCLPHRLVVKIGGDGSNSDIIS